MKITNDPAKIASDFEKILPLLKSQEVVLTTHDQADIDAISSSIVLKYILENIFPNQGVFLYIPHLSKISRSYLDKFSKKFPTFKINLTPDPLPSIKEFLIILDTNNMDRVFFPENSPLNLINQPYIFIDHHHESLSNANQILKEYNLIFPQITSTSEIVLEISRALKLDLPPACKFLLLSGILVDSGFFRYGYNDTFKRGASLVNGDVSLNEIISVLEEEISIPERIAIIKGFQRVKLIREGDWLIGISHVGSYEAILATRLIKLGFDLGIVYSEKKEGFRISIRAKMNFCIQYGLNLGAIIESISNICDGSGGGHQCAASLNGKHHMQQTLDAILQKIIKSLKEREL